MAHIITNRSGESTLGSKKASEAELRLETIKAISYELGGVAFICGSIFYFPAFSEVEIIGQLLFFTGSVIFSFVTFSDLLQVIRYWSKHSAEDEMDKIELFIAIVYAIGSLLLLSGNFISLFISSASGLKPWMFIFGSILYVIGSFFNFLEIIKVQSLILLQLYNLTLVFFILGAVLFFTASIPYLWSLSDSTEMNFLTLAAAEYLAGSVFFFLGGVLITHRKFMNHKIKSYRRTSILEVKLIDELNKEIREKSNLSKYFEEKEQEKTKE